MVVRPPQLRCEQLEDRTTPAKFDISLPSPLTGEVGDTAATHSGTLALPNRVVDAADATAAVKAAFTGTISGAASSTHTFSAANVGSDKAFQIESNGEQYAIAFEDMAGMTGCDYDHNDRVWLMLVRPVGQQATVFTETTTWSAGANGTVQVALTVTANVPGAEGRYTWHYRVTNQTYNPQGGPNGGLGTFVLRVPEVSGVSSVWSSLGWPGQVGTFGGDPQAISWQAQPPHQRVLTGQFADFAFTTPVCGIGAAAGEMYSAALGQPGGGPAKGPELTIRSITLWGQPGSGRNPVAAAAGGGAAVAQSGAILETNPNAGGGKRIFPEKPFVNSASFEKVDVRVELSQAVTQATVVNMFQFDVDDPSSSDPDIDVETNSWDNRDANRDGAWATSFAINVGVGKSVGSALRSVGRQPGDNYRFAATIDPNVTLGGETEGANVVKVYRTHYSYPGNEFPTTVYSNDDLASVCFDSGEGTPVGTGMGKTVASQLLTVWRTLHVERDVMAAPPNGEPFAGAGALMPGSNAEGDKEGDDDVAPNGPNGTVVKPGIGLMQQNYRAAYIEVVDDLTTENTQASTPFVHNMNHEPVASWNPAANIRDVPSDEKFWTMQLIGGYEPRTDEDDDGANAAGTCAGITKHENSTSYVFTEVVRDIWETFGAQKKQNMPLAAYMERIALHESLHVFKFKHNVDPHADEGPLDAGLNRNGTDDDQKITPGQLGLIRSRPQPGRPVN